MRKFSLVNVLVLGGLHLFAVWVLWRVFHQSFALKPWALFVALWLLSGFGITIGYHRLFTHKSFKTGPVIQGMLLFAGGMALQGQAEGWVLDHRSHHAYVEKTGLDPHTPFEKQSRFRGFWWAHCGWLAYNRLSTVEIRGGGSDLYQNRLIQFQKRHYWVPITASFLLPFLIAGWDGLLIAGVLRTVFLLNITWCVNSVCHIWGRRAKDSQGQEYRFDNSRNNPIIAVLGMGEGNHATHHSQQKSAFVGGFDPSGWLIRLMAHWHLARDVVPLRKNIVFTERQIKPGYIQPVEV